MKRWARPILSVVVFLLLGAIVNIAVAWGCAAWLSVERAELAYPLRDPVSSNAVPCWAFNWVHRPGATRYVLTAIGQLSEYDSVVRDEIPHWSRTNAIRLSSEAVSHALTIVEDARGFPLNSLHCEFLLATTYSTPPWATGVEGGIPIDQSNWPSIPPAGSVFIRSPFLGARALPLRPIWPGFAIDTVFYAALLWMLFAAPFALRRRRRIKRGLCPKCAYPVGTNARCTECGAVVTTKAALP